MQICGHAGQSGEAVIALQMANAGINREWFNPSYADKHPGFGRLVFVLWQEHENYDDVYHQRMLQKSKQHQITTEFYSIAAVEAVLELADEADTAYKADSKQFHQPGYCKKSRNAPGATEVRRASTSSSIQSGAKSVDSEPAKIAELPLVFP
ncbi:hypothetical protein BOTBODRAFT_327537 [Botryobasidium botryosum FD-172 SS1]|uniref:Uncharacterized protein n=1 Tax=Botryobasidium botryosum (strain FD-172 SS1) TaxID=930990 RepID=A0A067MZL2_BOTB1|nr:hypothetical protein BOTBODRAFT_327537 [Botryobasidium botryosum FD-172 SS1]